MPQTGNPSLQFEPEIAAYEKRDKAEPPPTRAVLFVGSSSFRLWSDLETSFPKTKVINRGFGGSVIKDSTYYADRIVLPYHPRMVVLYAGDNDIAQGRTPEGVCADFVEFANKVRAGLPDVKIAYVSIKPCPLRWKLVDKVRDANSRIKRYIHTQKRMSYINVFDAQLGPDGQPIPELYREDGLHPTKACYQLWTKIIAPYLK